MNKKIHIEVEIISPHYNKRAVLQGYAYVEAGFLTGQFIGQDELCDAERILLSAFTFTGCPIAARSREENINPWVLTSGAYAGRRTLESERFVSRSRIYSRSIGNEVRMKLEVEYSGEIEGIVNIRRPFQERIVEKDIGIFNGEFDIDFVDERADLIKANAKTEYYLDIDQHFEPMWRNITIINTVAEDHFRQVEQIDLFGDGVSANDDLVSKLAIN